MEKKIIFFDFDGVLVDSFETAYETIIEMWPELPFSRDSLRACFEGNIHETFFKKYTDEKSEDAFFERYIPRILKLSVVPGMREALASLATEHRLVIVSSTRTEAVREWLERERIAELFEDVLGEEAGKSKTEKIASVLERYRADAADCLFVTDTLGDIEEADRADVRSIAVTWGYHREEMLRKGSPAGIVHRPEDLVAEVERCQGVAGGRERRVTTLVIVHQHPKVLLGMKKRGFGAGKWNGFGGKVEAGETIEEAARREVREEAGIELGAMRKIAVVTFETGEEDNECHFFKAESFSGELRETEEMRPRWFGVEEIPFAEMWPDDVHWMPLFLNDKTFTGRFRFSENDELMEYELTEAEDIS
jgi:8-oxo-dGTP diphosphatase / 2-hydroxy-dATP diphosphatase